MKIEISEKGSEAFYREVVNITSQYRFILKNHHHKLKDYFKQFRILLILGAAAMVILILMAIFWDVNPFDYAIIAVLGAVCGISLCPEQNAQVDAGRLPYIGINSR